MKFIAVIFFLILASVSAFAEDLLLDSKWSVELPKGTITLRDLSERGFLKSFPQGDNVQVKYTGKFQVESAAVGKNSLMILPATWLPMSIELNGIDITPAELKSSLKTKIYELNKVDIPGSFLKESNELKISISGVPMLQGFRGGDFEILPSGALPMGLNFRDFFINSIHSTVFLSCSILIGLFSLVLINLMGNRNVRHISLATASLMIVPYHLLTSEFYSFLFSTSDAPFKFQIYFQSISWLAWGYFLLSSTESKLVGSLLTKKWFFTGLVTYYGIVGVSAKWIPFHILSVLITPSLLIAIFVGSYWLYVQNRHQKFSFLIAAGALCFGWASLVSHILEGNLYFLGYTATFFMTLGFYDITSDFVKSSRRDRSAGQLLNNLLPTPIFSSVSSLLDTGAGPVEIRQALRGDGILTTIFVDICSYGEMSLRLPSKIVYLARTEVFEFLKTIAEQNEHFFIKSIGDSVHFAGGFGNDPSYKISQSKLSTSCLNTVKEMLDRVDELNLMLKEKDLPSVRLKVSASIGHGEFSLEGTNKQVRYDIVGHWVNVTKRLEEAMNNDFYKANGYNCALVSANLFSHCEDVNLRKRFMKEMMVTDKHGLKYPAYIGNQYVENVKHDDLLKAVYGQFSHNESDDKKKVG